MYKLFSPNLFLKISKFLIPFSGYFSLYNSPEDYQQGSMVRIMYVHVPSAWMSLGIYSFMAICSFSCLVWKTKMSYILSVSAAPIGAGFALITLVTGSIWGKPIWGTWWVWDARLTSMLVLFFIYISYIAIINSGNNLLRAEKPASVMAIIGFINIPIVKFSVDIWYSLHQPASILKLGGPSIHSSMLLPLFIMFGSFIMYFIFVLLLRAKIIIHKIKNNG
jgi:heme exporter protein C